MAAAESLRILSLDGGGIKGYTSLLILKRVFRTMVDLEGLSEELRPCDVFDLIVGTSTGGLIAVMLGRLRMTIDECLRLYTEIGKNVFGKRQSIVGKVAKGLFSSPFCDIKVFQKQIKDIIKTSSTTQEESFCETEENPSCRVMLCVTRVATSKPDVLRSYKSSCPTEENYVCQIWEAASATAAAPMFFKGVEFQGTHEKWCDGGLHRNNPIREALAEVAREKAWRGKQIGCVLSLGTGVPKTTSISTNLAVFVKGALDIMTDADNIADQFSVSEEGRTLADSRRYFRFSVPQGMQDLELDEWKEMEKMNALTIDYLRKAVTGKMIEQCAKSLLHPDENLQIGRKSVPSILPNYTCTHFVDREMYSQKLHDFFKPWPRVRQMFVLWGLGGIGKTQLALQFAHSVKHRLAVFWVRADKFTNFASDYVKILSVLRSDSKANTRPENQEEMLEHVTLELESTPTDWLLVLDNADNLDEYLGRVGTEEIENDISKHVPRQGRILITTRDSRFQGDVAPASHGVQVQPMTPVEAKDLLLRSISRPIETTERELSGRSVENLLEELGNLPLAIAQAAANIRHLSWSIQDYVAAYRNKKQRMTLMKTGTLDTMTKDPRTRDQSIFVTWELSFEYLERTFPDSAACLCYMGCYQYRAIPKVLLKALPQFKDLTPLQFQGVIQILLHLSLVEQTEEVPETEEYHIHPVVHERILDRLAFEEQRQYLEPNIDIMSTVFPLCNYEQDKRVPIGRYLLLHAVNFVDLGSELSVVSRSCARLLQVVSRLLSVLGITRLSVTLATKALDMTSVVWDKGHPSVLFVRHVKIQCLNRDARCEEALLECNTALEYLNSPSILDGASQDQLKDVYEMVMSEKTYAYNNSGKWAQTEEFFRQQLASEHAPKQGLALVVMRHNLANSLKSQNDASKIVEAKAINAELLAWAESAEGKPIMDKSLYLKLLNLKAHILRYENRLPGSKGKPQTEKCSQIYLRVYETSLEFLGPDDLDTWKAANNVTSSLTEEGQLEQAMLILERFLGVVATSRARLEGQFLVTFTLTWYNTINLIYELNRKRRQYDISKLDQLWNILNETTRALSGDPEEIMKDTGILNLLGVTHLHQGRFAEGEQTFRVLLSNNMGSLSVASGLDYISLYNLMLAIAWQPGRLEEAYEYRAEHEADIIRAEAIYGHLTTRMERFDQDRLAYAEAQSRLAAGDLFLGDDWWTEHEEAMARAERMYGFLNVPERKPPETETTSTEDQGTPVVVSKNDRKGKSRAFSRVAVFRRKKDKGDNRI